MKSVLGVFILSFICTWSLINLISVVPNIDGTIILIEFLGCLNLSASIVVIFLLYKNRKKQDKIDKFRNDKDKPPIQ